MSDQPTLSEIFMSKARARIAYYNEISNAINGAEEAVDGNERLRSYKGVEEDVDTWEGVSGVAVNMLSIKGEHSAYLSTYHGYMSQAKDIIKRNKNEGRGFQEELRQFQVEQNCRKLGCNAMNLGLSVVLYHLEDKRGGDIAEKDLKAAFRGLDRHLKEYRDLSHLGYNMVALRDDIVREIRDVAIESRKEFKAMQPAV